jgi:hypothetical protein
LVINDYVVTGDDVVQEPVKDLWKTWRHERTDEFYNVVKSIERVRTYTEKDGTEKTVKTFSFGKRTDRKKNSKKMKRKRDVNACAFIDNTRGIVISYKDLSRVPPCLENYSGLARLDLDDNRITKIDGLDNLKALEFLNLDNNNIEKVEGIDNLTGLRNLSLDHNRISKIEGLDNLKSLENLDLSGNRITKIEGIKNLKGLEILSLDNNGIEKIEGLDNLKALEYLSLEGNNLKAEECQEFREKSMIETVHC